MTLRLLISGFVQGVGFRHYLKSNAQSLNLTGWVKNISGGNVEVTIQGDEKNIETLIALSKKGPFLSEVEKIEVEKITDPQQFDKFEILK